MDDALHRRQTYSRSGELAAVVQPLKGAEQLAGVSHVEARAVVPHVVYLRAVSLVAGELYPRNFALARELPGVAQQVEDGDPEEALVALCLHALRHDDLGPALRRVARELLQQL